MNNVNFKQVVEDSRNLTRMFRSVQQLQEALEHIGSIEQATKDAEQARAVAVDDRERAVQAAQQAGQQLTAVLAEVSEAKAKAKQALNDASDKADSIVVAAEGKAAEIIAAAERREADAAAAVVGYNNQVEDAKAVVELKRKEFTELEAKIGKLKAQAAKLIGE